nr:MAG TPA: hypothetical protein [Caudoviricetes sp.]
MTYFEKEPLADRVHKTHEFIPQRFARCLSRGRLLICRRSRGNLGERQIILNPTFIGKREGTKMLIQFLNSYRITGCPKTFCQVGPTHLTGTHVKQVEKVGTLILKHTHQLIAFPITTNKDSTTFVSINRHVKSPWVKDEKIKRIGTVNTSVAPKLTWYLLHL